MDHGVPVVMGGLHVTACPQEAKEHCSAVVLGEGEAHWAELLKDSEKGEAPALLPERWKRRLRPGPGPHSPFRPSGPGEVRPPHRADEQEGAHSAVSSVPVSVLLTTGYEGEVQPTGSWRRSGR